MKRKPDKFTPVLESINCIDIALPAGSIYDNTLTPVVGGIREPYTPINIGNGLIGGETRPPGEMTTIGTIGGLIQRDI